jgi:hypothetical protein
MQFDLWCWCKRSGMISLLFAVQFHGEVNRWCNYVDVMLNALRNTVLVTCQSLFPSFGVLKSLIQFNFKFDD